MIQGVFYSILWQAQQECSGQQVHGNMVMRAGPDASLVLVQSQAASLGLELGFNAPLYDRVGYMGQISTGIGLHLGVSPVP